MGVMVAGVDVVDAMTTGVDVVDATMIRTNVVDVMMGAAVTTEETTATMLIKEQAPTGPSKGPSVGVNLPVVD